MIVGPTIAAESSDCLNPILDAVELIALFLCN